MAAPLGNQNAAKAKEWQQALRRAMARKAGGDFRQTLDEIAEVVVNMALAGSKDAWMEIANREDGKPAQPIGGADDLPPIEQRITEIRRTIVYPEHTDSGSIRPTVETGPV